MKKVFSTFYTKEQLKGLQRRGVIIPDLSSVKIGQEISPEKIAPGSVIYPFVKICGEQTNIRSGAKIGIFGSVILHDSWIGKNVIIANSGPVTLKNVVVGADSILGSGVAENSVFLGKETFENNFTTGYGFSIRKGSLLEEDSSVAQHTDTKMTILFPWVTLGSNINFCDVIITGGKGPEMGLFSEVGSGTIHFNYSIRGDKATASIFGDVTRGVFLNKDRIFIGGNNSLIGPISSDFGVMTAADSRIDAKLSKGLSFGKSLSGGNKIFDYKTFVRVLDIFTEQVNVLAELAALYNWYKQIRISCIARNIDQKFVYSSGLKIIELNFNERLFQISQFINSVENSHGLIKNLKKLPKKEILEQKELIKKWPSIEKKLSNLNNFELSAPAPFKNSIFEQISIDCSSYTNVIKNLSEESKKEGEKWLNGISEKVRKVLSY